MNLDNMPLILYPYQLKMNLFELHFLLLFYLIAASTRFGV